MKLLKTIFSWIKRLFKKEKQPVYTTIQVVDSILINIIIPETSLKASAILLYQTDRILSSLEYISYDGSRF